MGGSSILRLMGGSGNLRLMGGSSNLRFVSKLNIHIFQRTRHTSNLWSANTPVYSFFRGTSSKSRVDETTTYLFRPDDLAKSQLVQVVPLLDVLLSNLHYSPKHGQVFRGQGRPPRISICPQQRSTSNESRRSTTHPFNPNNENR